MIFSKIASRCILSCLVTQESFHTYTHTLVYVYMWNRIFNTNKISLFVFYYQKENTKPKPSKYSSHKTDTGPKLTRGEQKLSSVHVTLVLI